MPVQAIVSQLRSLGAVSGQMEGMLLHGTGLGSVAHSTWHNSKQKSDNKSILRALESLAGQLRAEDPSGIKQLSTGLK